MPWQANFQNVQGPDLPIVVDFRNPQYDARAAYLQDYEAWNLGYFLYFRFDEWNWIPKKALGQYNREWSNHQLEILLAADAKSLFFCMHDTTQQNFFLGLQDVVSCWLSRTNSGRPYHQQYTYHCGIQ